MSWVRISTGVSRRPSTSVWMRRVTMSSRRSSRVVRVRVRSSTYAENSGWPPPNPSPRSVRERFHAHGLVPADDRVHDAANLAVPRLGHLGQQLLLLGDDDARLAIARAERVDIAHRVLDVFVTGEQPTDVDAAHRARRAHLAQRVDRYVGGDVERVVVDSAHDEGIFSGRATGAGRRGGVRAIA